MVRHAAFFGILYTLVSATICWGQAGATGAHAICPPPGDLTPKPGEHPLAPLIRWGKAGIAALEKVEDYSCRLVKRERVGGRLGGYQWMSIKVRQHPFSVYAAFTNKTERPWQEVVFVENRDGGKMLVHSDEYRLMGTVSLFPDSDRAMRDNRYPLTEVGVLKLIQRLVEHAENDSKFDDCEVKIYKDAKIESRPCLYIRVTHKEKRPEFSFHMARIFIDNELNVPVRYEAFSWPEEPNGKPVPTEEYTYLDFQPNQHYSDRDFDFNNPDYYFPPDFGEPEVDLGRDKPLAEVPLPTGQPAPKDAQPLGRAIALVRDTAAHVDKVPDYTCLLSHRAQTGTDAARYENLLLKIRHQPLGIYAFFLGPKTPKGQEAIYRQGAGSQKVITHTVGAHGRPSVTREEAPNSPDLVTAAGESFQDLGLKAQLARWLAMYEAELPHGEATVQYYPQVEVDQRLATCLEVTHPTARPHFRFQKSRLYIDQDHHLPVRFEAYGWPTAAGGAAPLVEEFTYRNLELNRGYTDHDFDTANPNYAFGKKAATPAN